MSEDDSNKMTSEEIFLQYCMAKPKKAMEFMEDYILYLLKIENPFESEKYTKLQNFILDFMVGADIFFDIFLKFYSKGKKLNYNKDEFISLFKEEFNEIDSSVIDFSYNFFIANLNNLQFLRSKKYFEFYKDEICNFKTNLQLNLGHSSIANEEPDFNVLLKIVKNKGKIESKNEKNILEINDKELDALINKLKDIYGQIKS